MQFFIFVLLICLFIFLFCVYFLAKDDLILLRKDVSMEKFFNIIFLGSLICLLIARLFYGVFQAKNIILNPFVFLLFPYFPGLSLVGGVIGGGIFFLYLFLNKKKQLPLGRIFDFCSIGFLVTLPVGILGYFMFAEEKFSVIRTISLMVVYVVLFMIFWKLFLPRMLSGKFKDGTITFLFIICFSIISLISHAIGNFKEIFFLENIILSLMFVASVSALIWQENIIGKIKKFELKRS